MGRGIFQIIGRYAGVFGDLFRDTALSWKLRFSHPHELFLGMGGGAGKRGGHTAYLLGFYRDDNRLASLAAREVCRKLVVDVVLIWSIH